MARANKVKVPVEVSLPEDAFNRLMALDTRDIPESAKIQGMVSSLVDELVSGGMMLTGDGVNRLKQVLPNADEDEIIESVEKAENYRAGQVVAEWIVDPTMIQPLKDKAEEQGIDVKALVQNMIDTAVNNGWFYELNCQPRALFFDPKDMDRLKRITELDDGFTGNDLTRWLCDRSGIPYDEPEEQDLLSLMSGETVNS